MKRIAAAAGAATALVAGLSLAVPASQATAAGARAVAPAASLPVMTITMNGKSVTVTGSTRSGGVEIVSKVSGEAQGDPTLVRLDPGVSVGQLLKAASGDPNNIALIASVVFSPAANRGTSEAQAYLRPGNYVAVDLAMNAKIPPLTTFTVTPAASPARLPKPGASLSAIEFGFRGAGRLRDGELVRFGNKGFLVHMMLAARARSKADAVKIARYLREGKTNKASKLATGLFTIFNLLTHDAYQQQVVHYQPGYYVLLCLMQTQDGRDHTQLAMERVIRVVR
jgi:hypothetical protein